MRETDRGTFQVVQEVIGLVKRDVDEPLERQLFREAWNLRGQYPKASLVIGVAAAEIGFRNLIGPIGGRKAISTLLAKYLPGPPSNYRIQGKEIKPSASILKVLKEGIQKRNAVIHEGAQAPGVDDLREILYTSASFCGSGISTLAMRGRSNISVRILCHSDAVAKRDSICYRPASFLFWP